MIHTFFDILRIVDSFYWSYIGFTIVVFAGIYLTIKLRFLQFKVLFSPIKTFKDLHRSADKTKGTSPLRLYFASIGGMVGLGNIVGIITALLVGGPGSLFWLWFASFSGMLIKYAETYLGVRYRVENKEGGYDGGPMYFLKIAFKGNFFPILVSFLLCIYGVEVYQFLIVTDILSMTFSIPKTYTVSVLLIAIIYTGLGGISRLANICSIFMPIFMFLYLVVCLWMIGHHFFELPGLLALVVKSAFTGHASIGGFAGSTFLLTAQQGIARAVYSGDIGVGYDATIQSETQSTSPSKQAKLAVFALLTDTTICSLSILVVLVSGIWKLDASFLPSEYVALALSEHFPYIKYFMGVILFLAGYSALIAYFAVGAKSAKYLWNNGGVFLYYLYAILAFVFFSFHDQDKVILMMSMTSGLLMIINVFGIMKLRHEIKAE